MKSLKYSTVTFTITLLLTLVSPTTGIAKDKSSDAIKYRQSGMMFMRWNMGIIKKLTIKNPDSYDEDKVIAAANVINAISNSGIEGLFTHDSNTGIGWKETRVNPELVNQSSKVDKYISRLTQESRKLVKAADTRNINVIQKQFKNVLQACKSCHKAYRRK